MRTTAICFLLIAALAGGALGYTDSLRCRLVDWMDARSNHKFLHERSGVWPEAYDYTGCRWWDLDMGDSVLVWLPGSQKLFFVDPYNTTAIDTIYSRTSFGSGWTASEISDSTLFMISAAYYGAVYIQDDSTNYISSNVLPWASFSYLAHEDSFLYTFNREHVTHDTVGIICINVADPENMFIYRWIDDFAATAGLEVLNGYCYAAKSYSLYSEDSSGYDAWTRFGISRLDMVNSDYPMWVSGGYSERGEFFGDIACDGKSRVYAVNTQLSPWPAWDIGESHLYVIGTDTSYTFNQRWEGMAVFGVDVISDSLVVAGFEHGFSVLNVADLDDIHEVAYYMNEDTTMDFTNFALKGNRLYAMGHWEDDSTWARLWMFELDDSVVTGLVDAEPEMPERLRLRSYPNPFNSAVTIALDCRGLINQTPTVEIFDLNGRKIDVIARRAEPNEAISPNNRSSVPLDTRRDAVSINNCEFIWQPDPSLGSGVYLVRARVGGRGDLDPTEKTATKRIVYLK